MILNVLSMGFTIILRLLVNAGLLLIVARYIGAEEYGVFATSMAITFISIVLVDFGYSTYIVKSVAENRSLLREHMTNAVCLKSYMLPLYIIMCQIMFVFLMDSAYFIEFNFIVFITLMASASDFVNVAFRSISKFSIETKVNVSSSIIHLAFVIPTAYLLKELFFVVVALFISKVVTFILALREYKKEFVTIDYPKLGQFKIEGVINEFMKVKFFAIDNIIINFRANIDVILIRFFLGFSAVGLYQAGMNITKGLERAGPVLSSVYLPKLAKRDEKFKAYYVQLCFLMVLAPISIISFMMYIDFNWLLGEEFGAVNEMMPLFMAYLFIRYLCMTVGVLMTACNLQRARVYIGITNFITLVIMFTVLIPIYKLDGALYSLIASALFLLLGFIASVLVNRNKILR